MAKSFWIKTIQNMWIGIMNKLIYGSIYRQQVIFRGNEGFKVRPVFVLFTDDKYLGQTIGMDLDMFELHMSSLGY